MTAYLLAIMFIAVILFGVMLFGVMLFGVILFGVMLFGVMLVGAMLFAVRISGCLAALSVWMHKPRPIYVTLKSCSNKCDGYALVSCIEHNVFILRTVVNKCEQRL
jgi:hypothetical protein